MRQNITIISFLLIVLNIQAQDKKWTLQECMKYAVENSPRKDKREAQNSIYNQNYIEAAGAFLPTISANTSTSFNYGRGLDAETNTYTNINSFSNSYNAYASMVLFDGFANLNSLKVQKMNRIMGKQELQGERDMIAIETMEAYYNVLYFVKLVQLAGEQLNSSKANHQQVKRMAELGVKGFPDVAEMAAQEAADTYNLTKQQNLYSIGVILLKEKMNFPLDEELVIDDREIKLSIVEKSVQTAMAIYDIADDINPKAVSASAAVDAQKYAYRAAKGRVLPRISGEAGYGTNFSRYMDGSDYVPFGEQLKNKRGHYFGLALSIPVFSGFSRSANIKRNKAQLIIAEAEKQQTLRTLYSEIEQAVADMNGQADAYVQSVRQTESMNVAHQVNQKKFSEGLISPIELHISANRLQQARAEELNAMLKYELKARLVDYYKGVPFLLF
jgi:outer membrane protein